MKIIIAGGGTGGHVLAGVSVAQAWKARFGDESVLFVGARGGIEERLVPKAGFGLQLLSIGALNRVGFKKQILTMLKLPLAFVRSLEILIQVRPQVVLGVGGYASGPFVMAAAFLSPFLKIRTAILEQNSVPGLTNQWLGRMVQKVFVAFDGSQGGFPMGKAKLSGNPVRSELVRLPVAPVSPFTVFVFGGSQGAKGINTLVLEALEVLKAEGSEAVNEFKWIHQTGTADLERVRAGHLGVNSQGRVVPFIDDMKSAYTEASLVVCRAGASTLSELAAVGRAAILIPFPQAADNHQEKNARLFVDAGAAEMLLQSGATGKDLVALLRKLKTNPDQIRAMEEKMKSLHKPECVSMIVEALTHD